MGGGTASILANAKGTRRQASTLRC
jgi:hypothetical protein